MSLKELVLETEYTLKAGSLDPTNPYFFKPKVLGAFKDVVEAQEAFLWNVAKHEGSFELRRADGSMIVAGVHYPSGLKRVSIVDGGKRVDTLLKDYWTLLRRYYPEGVE